MLIILSVLLLSACAVWPDPVCVKENRIYCKSSGNFTGRWYDYYERALSCLEGKCYEAALADLNEALKMRNKDQRLARTFGMHFSDYFPHREKGLIHYFTGDYEAAKSELEHSIRQYPSEKAYFYLDKVRIRLMEHTQISLPRLFVNVGSELRGQGSGAKYPEPVWTKDDPVIISGTAEDEQYISEILLKGKALFLEKTSPEVRFEEKLKLEQGPHEIRIIARNLRKQETVRKLFIHVDRLGPVISLTAFGPGQGIQGRLYDESGEIHLFADGKNIPVPKGETAEFSIPEKEEMILIAKDRLGNETFADLRDGILADSGILLAQRETGCLSQTYLCRENNTEALGRKSRNMSLPLSVSVCLPASAAEKGHVVADAARHGRSAPEIILERQSAEMRFDAFCDTYLKGCVRSKNTVVKLTVNGTPVLIQPGRVIFFNHFVRLEKGKNTIRIAAEDEFGNRGFETLDILAEVPEAFKLKHRYCFALHPFEKLGDSQDRKERLFGNFFLEKLSNRSRFQVILRNSESPKPESGPANPPSAVLLGNFYETQNGIEIAARLTDISSGEILAVKDVFGESKDPAALEALSEKLSEKFHRAFPLMDASVTKVADSGSDFFPEKWIPEKAEIRSGWNLIIYRGRGEIIGKTKVSGISEDIFRAEPLSGRQSEIRPGDRIISE